MKRINTLTLFLLLGYIGFAQAPKGFNYQAVVRDAQGYAVQNQNVSIRLSIHDGGPMGNIIYQETDTTPANQFGVITVVVGGGSIIPGTNTFDAIDWSTGNKFLEVETDITGGTAYLNMGTTQLLSVPYALYAETAGSTLPGPTGATGPQGDPGVAGPQGPMGATGLQGADGAQGIQGPTGPQGADGAQGVQGPTGAQGNDGVQGPKGDTGDTGPQGPMGVTGIQGPTGIQGLMGPTGAQGLQGLQGATGIQGDKGDKGDTGDTGPQGPAGVQGPIGVTGIQGPTGAQGLQGLQGATGIQGAKGDKGDTGDAGPQGPAGVQGPIGVTGIQGPTGAQGIAGTPGAQGVPGPTGFADSVWTRNGNDIYNNNPGRVGIKTASPQADLDVNGFTKLGSDAPVVKMKKVTGVAPSNAGGSSSFNLGILDSKILDVQVFVNSPTGGLLTPLLGATLGIGGADYTYAIKNSVFTFSTSLLNSTKVLGQPYNVLITYEQ